jgi:outer membrane immunogenic protein
MKMFYLGAAMAAACLSVAAPASAEYYGSLNAGSESLDFSSVGAGTANLTVIGGSFTWKKKWYGAEGDLLFGVNSDSVGVANLKAKVTSAAFIYGVAYLPLGKNFDLMARAGYGHQAAKISGSGVSVDTNDGAFAYGGAAQYMFNAKNGARLDYTHLDIDQAPTDLWTLGYVRKF